MTEPFGSRNALFLEDIKIRCHNENKKTRTENHIGQCAIQTVYYME